MYLGWQRLGKKMPKRCHDDVTRFLLSRNLYFFISNLNILFASKNDDVRHYYPKVDHF